MESERGHARQDDGVEVDLLVRHRALPRPDDRSTGRILQAARAQAERRRSVEAPAPRPVGTGQPAMGGLARFWGWFHSRRTLARWRWAVAAPALGALVLAVTLWRTPQTSDPTSENGAGATAASDIETPIIILPLGDPFLDELDWRLNRVSWAVGALGAGAATSSAPSGGAALDGRLQALRQSARTLSQDLESWDGPIDPAPGPAPLDNDTLEDTSWQWPMTGTHFAQEV